MTSTQIIPRHIHQIFWDFSGKNKPIKKMWKHVPNMWKQMHPNWNYTLWNDKMILQLIDTYFPTYKSLYNSYKKYPIIQCDIARLMILFIHGGMYIDMDVEPRKPFDDLFEQYEQQGVYVLIPPEKLQNISNWLIISPANHAFIGRNISKLKPFSKLSWWYYLAPNARVFHAAGPDHISKQYEYYKKRKNDIKKLPSHFQKELKESFFHTKKKKCDTCYVNHLKGSTWLEWHSYIIYSILAIIVVSLIIWWIVHMFQK